MIVNWMCLFVYLKYKFGSTYLLLFVSQQLIIIVLKVLIVSSCKSVILSWLPKLSENPSKQYAWQKNKQENLNQKEIAKYLSPHGIWFIC